ncbi:hypothetical protein DIPPA_15343 [Diplonema papillatum]|nr:hypothetical protein DIPPA_15343 [Diplonema papillatum]
MCSKECTIASRAPSSFVRSAAGPLDGEPSEGVSVAVHLVFQAGDLALHPQVVRSHALLGIPQAEDGFLVLPPQELPSLPRFNGLLLWFTTCCSQGTFSRSAQNG